MALCRLDWAVLMLGFVNVAFSMSEDCYKMDVCSCRFKNGSIVSLWPVDGGSKGPSFTDIPGRQGRVFDWNPCTPFNESRGISNCADVMVCQLAVLYGSPAGSKDTNFSVDSSGNVVISYAPMPDSSTPPYARESQITLKCDPNEPGKGTIPSFTETRVSSDTSLYSGTLTSKYACVGTHSFSMAI